MNLSAMDISGSYDALGSSTISQRSTSSLSQSQSPLSASTSLASDFDAVDLSPAVEDASVGFLELLVPQLSAVSAQLAELQ